MRRHITSIGLILLFGATSALAINSMQGEVQIEAASRVERNAGVWLDDQYIGYVRNLRRSGKLVLVPGEHRLVFKLIGYEDLESTIVVEPGDDLVCTFADDAAGPTQVFVSRSTNSGGTWSAMQRVDDGTGGTAPAITVQPTGQIYLVWEDDRLPGSQADVFGVRGAYPP